MYTFSIWTSPIINICSDGLGHFQSYRLRNPHMPEYERLGICLAESCLLGLQLCPKVSCSLLFLFILILCACFGPLIGLLASFSAAWPLFVLFLWAAPLFKLSIWTYRNVWLQYARKKRKTWCVWNKMKNLFSIITIIIISGSSIIIFFFLFRANFALLWIPYFITLL